MCDSVAQRENGVKNDLNALSKFFVLTLKRILRAEPYINNVTIRFF